MEPLTPNDPLWKLLGQSKQVQPRPNFVQNVLREARQTPQELGWLARVSEWWHQREGIPGGLAWAAVAVVAVSFVAVFQMSEPSQTTAEMAAISPATEAVVTETDFPLTPEFETEWKSLEQMGDLLAVQDTSQFTDTEINLLLY